MSNQDNIFIQEVEKQIQEGYFTNDDGFLKDVAHAIGYEGNLFTLLQCRCLLMFI